MRILLVEDEELIASVIRQGLVKAGYEVDWAADGAEGLAQAQKNAHSVIVLDLMLPKMDGLSICRQLRSERVTTPILMLTARDAVPDRVRGLESGADDYLPKPFDFTELQARIEALMRRDRLHKARQIQIGDLEIDTKLRQVRRAGQEVSLTPREYALLEALAANSGQTLSREVIQDQVWMDEESYSNTVDVYIGLLRKKIDAGQSVKLIQTVHGVGYVLKAPEV